jgi:hypothetical protein
MKWSPWKPIRVTNATSAPWKRYISASMPSPRDMTGTASSGAREQPFAEAVEVELAKIEDGTLSAPSKNRLRRWTQDELKVLKNGVEAGLPDRLIAQKLPGRTIASVITKSRRTKMNSASLLGAEVPWTSEEKAELLRLVQAGVTLKHVLPLFPHRSASSVAVAFDRTGVPGWHEGNAKRKRKQWSAAELQRLQDLLTQGIPTRSIAKMLGCSVSAVQQKKREADLPLDRRGWTLEEDNTLKTMIADGYTLGHVAEELGKHRVTVHRRSFKIVPTRFSPVPDERMVRGWRFRLSSQELEEIENLRAQGTSWEAIRTERFPHVKMRSLIVKFKEQKGRLPLHRIAPALHMSEEDMEDIERILKTVPTFSAAARVKFPDRRVHQVRQAFHRRKERGQDLERPRGRPPTPTLPVSDLEDIERLRKAGTTWASITELKYPDWNAEVVRRAFTRQMEARMDEESKVTSSRE